MSYAVIPPNSLILRIETPPMFEKEPRREKPSPCRWLVSGGTYPGGGGSAPPCEQASCGELKSNSEQGSFCTWAVLSPVCEPTYIMPVSMSTAAPPSMLTPPLAPGEYQAHV